MFTRARLVLATWFSIALLATLVVVGGVAYVLIRRDLDREIDESLEATQELLQEPQFGPRPGLNEARRSPDGVVVQQGSLYVGGPLPPGIPSDVFVVYTDSHGAIEANPRNVDVDDVNFATLCDEATNTINARATTDLSAEGGNYRIVTVRGGQSGDWVHIGRSLEARDRQLRTLSTTFLVGGVGGAGLAILGGIWLAGLALRPIRDSFERQRRFVSDASHELRTPLAVMRANGELLQRHSGDTIAENMDQVEAITAEAEAMTKLVDDLLTLARADEGAANLAKERVPLGAVLEELGRDMTALATEKGIALSVDVAPVEVEGDRHRLRQLATILLDNALKYTPSGGRVALRATQSHKTIELSVTDSGPGIPVEEQARIFDRFVRADSARTRAAGGSGLGLAIARWIAEAHGGRIAVESTPGRGAKFIVKLPAAG